MFDRRKLEQATYDSVAFCFVTGNQHPDHDIISMFRKRFSDELKDLFNQILIIAHEMGILKLGTVSAKRQSFVFLNTKDKKMIRAENINNNSIVTEVLKHLTFLPVNLQEEVLEFVVKLKRTDFHGISGSQLIRYAGMISSDDLNIMSQVIEKDCGKIDINEW